MPEPQLRYGGSILRGSAPAEAHPRPTNVAPNLEIKLGSRSASCRADYSGEDTDLPYIREAVDVGSIRIMWIIESLERYHDVSFKSADP